MLKPFWHKWDRNNPPKHLKMPANAEAPDLWIEPRYSKVLQIKAGQVVVAEKYGIGYTLRFPRVQQIRFDKAWHESATAEEFLAHVRQTDGRYGHKSVKHLFAGSGEPASGKRKRASATPAAALLSRQKMLLPSVAAADTSHVKKLADVFTGSEFCVLSGGSATTPGADKQSLERLIVAHGGTVVQVMSPVVLFFFFLLFFFDFFFFFRFCVLCSATLIFVVLRCCAMFVGCWL